MTARPRPPERLEKTLARVAREQGIDQERLRRWVSFLALCGLLERAATEGILGSYYLKGGVAMELRFAQRARATKDLDLGINASRANRLQTLYAALSLGFDQFTFRVKAQTRDMEQADTIRVQVALQCKTPSWQTIDVDLGPATIEHFDLIAPKRRRFRPPHNCAPNHSSCSPITIKEAFSGLTRISNPNVRDPFSGQDLLASGHLQLLRTFGPLFSLPNLFRGFPSNTHRTLAQFAPEPSRRRSLRQFVSFKSHANPLSTSKWSHS